MHCSLQGKFLIITNYGESIFYYDQLHLSCLKIKLTCQPNRRYYIDCHEGDKFVIRTKYEHQTVQMRVAKERKGDQTHRNHKICTLILRWWGLVPAHQARSKIPKRYLEASDKENKNAKRQRISFQNYFGIGCDTQVNN